MLLLLCTSMSMIKRLVLPQSNNSGWQVLSYCPGMRCILFFPYPRGTVESGSKGNTPCGSGGFKARVRFCGSMGRKCREENDGWGDYREGYLWCLRGELILRVHTNKMNMVPEATDLLINWIAVVTWWCYRLSLITLSALSSHRSTSQLYLNQGKAEKRPLTVFWVEEGVRIHQMARERKLSQPRETMKNLILTGWCVGKKMALSLVHLMALPVFK